jgi:hypothetical protein
LHGVSKAKAKRSLVEEAASSWLPNNF